MSPSGVTDVVLYNDECGVRAITLNRHDSKNAMDLAMRNQIAALAAEGHAELASRTRWCLALNAAALLLGGCLWTTPAANADNKRLNASVADNVYTVQRQAGCTTNLHVNPQLRLAAQWHTDDVLNDRNLDGDIGTDGSNEQDRAAAAGFSGKVQETVAINPALSISGIELINQWYSNPAYLAIMRNCANSQIGVWSESSLDRTVVVAVYGEPA
jgi:hypothetical protein